MSNVFEDVWVEDDFTIEIVVVVVGVVVGVAEGAKVEVVAAAADVPPIFVYKEWEFR